MRFAITSASGCGFAKRVRRGQLTKEEVIEALTRQGRVGR
jgi:hypothetical protein